MGGANICGGIRAATGTVAQFVDGAGDNAELAQRDVIGLGRRFGARRQAIVHSHRDGVANGREVRRLV